MPKHLPNPLRRVIKATGFWKDNALVLQELRHFPRIVALAILFPMIAAIFEGFGISFLLGFLQNLVNDAAVFRTNIGWFDTWILGTDKPDLERLYRVSLLILASTWLRACFAYLGSIMTRFSEAKLVDRLYEKIFEQLQSLSLEFYSTTKPGALINTMTTEVFQLRQVMASLGVVISRGSSLVVYTAIAIWISLPLSLMAVMMFSLTAVGISNLNRKVRAASFPVTAARKHFAAQASELINGMRTVQAFATQDYERRRFHEASQEIVDTVMYAAKQGTLVRPVAEGTATTSLVIIVIVSMTFGVSQGTMQVASLLTFMFILFRIVPSIQQLISLFTTLNSLQGSMQNIQELLRRDDKPYLKNGTLQFTGLKRAIECIEVDFGYDPELPVLHDITLTIPKEKTIALVGASGAGKSTLADLLPRFYDVNKGQILFDGVDVREFDINSIRRSMAIVSQDTFIFNTSARNNIAYGSEGATDAEIYEAARLANALQFIQELPEGFETVLGDRGVRLSGGQRQRIAIARALLKNPQILILDEATSALDSVSEKLIQESIDQLSVGRTVIAIAHRLSTIMNADKVVVMDKGRIIEQGTYQDLLERRGKLWQYHQMQQVRAS